MPLSEVPVDEQMEREGFAKVVKLRLQDFSTLILSSVLCCLEDNVFSIPG